MGKNAKYLIDSKIFREIKDAIKDKSEEEQIKTENLKIAREEERVKKEKASKIEYDAVLKAVEAAVAVSAENAKRRDIPILKRAYELKQEAEEEIVNTTSMILSAKCNAINNEILENKTIKRKGEEEKAYKEELLLKQETLASIIKFNNANEAEKLRRDIYAIELRKQIKDNEFKKKYSEDAKLEEDTRIRIAAANDALRAEERYLNEKIEKKNQTRLDLALINTQLNDMKLIEKKIADEENQKRLDYDREKYRKIAEYEEEMKHKKFLRELEIKKISESQQSSQDMQALRDLLAAERNQDKVEREWRRKELENLKRVTRINDELKESRRQQIADNQVVIINDQRNEKERSDQITRFIREGEKRTMENNKQTKIKAEKHLISLKEQIVDKEKVRIEERREFFQEGVTYQENKDARNNVIRDTIIQKIGEMKRQNVPKKSIQNIELKLKKKKWI